MFCTFVDFGSLQDVSGSCSGDGNSCAASSTPQSASVTPAPTNAGIASNI